MIEYANFGEATERHDVRDRYHCSNPLPGRGEGKIRLSPIRR
jgi:hypothetical protein